MRDHLAGFAFPGHDMALKNIAPRRDQRSAEAAIYRRWYKLKRWTSLRWSVLVRDMFTCQRCGLTEGNTAKLVADHKREHKGNPDLFWDMDNLHCLCGSCHSSAKQSEERTGKPVPLQVVGVDGWPV